MGDLLDFADFLNESEGADSRGFGAGETIKRLKMLVKVLPDGIQFGVPADFNGHSTTYKDIKEAVRRIQDLDHSYRRKNQEVTFYCWTITFNGSLEAEDALKKKMDEKGMLNHKNQEKYGRYNLKKIAQYFSKNQEDSDNIKSFTLSIDTKPLSQGADQDAAPKEQSEEPSDKPQKLDLNPGDDEAVEKI